MIRRAPLALAVLLVAGPGAALRAQERSVAARVVEIAGTNLYVNVGATAGLTAGDTLVVRRAAAAPPVGALVVVAAGAERALLTFAGRPFPLTRGDELLLSLPGPAPSAAEPAAPTPPSPAAPRAPSPVPLPAAPRPEPRRPAAARELPVQARGSAALEVYGSSNTTVGLGADPASVTRTFALPSLRLQTSVWNLPGGGRFSVNLRLTQQTGSAALFQRSSVVRIFDAHYEEELPKLRMLAGRFFSPYEPFSGSWDGVLVRVGPQAFGVGVEAGFMPSRGDETFNTDIPKYAAFAGFRYRGQALRLDEDLSAHAWRPQQGAVDRTFVGWSQRLGLFGVRLDHRVEVDQQPDGWNLTRLDARLGVPLGSRMEVSAEYFRDHLNWSDIPLDSLTARIDSLTSPRERFTTGGSYQLGMAYLSADLTLLLSGNDVRGQTYSGSLRLPEIANRVALGGMVTYWTVDTGTGVVIGPALDIRLGRLRSRAGYQYFQSTFNGVSTATHGADLSLTAPWGRQLESVFGITLRYGPNLKSQNAYSSLRLTF